MGDQKFYMVERQKMQWQKKRQKDKWWYISLHRKLMIKQCELSKKNGMILGSGEG
jgi:hypothetical protein